MPYQFTTYKLLLFAALLTGSRLYGQTVNEKDSSDCVALNIEVVKKFKAGQKGEAIELALKAKEKAAATFGTKHSSYIGTLNNLAYGYHSTGNYAAAEQTYKEILQITASAAGKDPMTYITPLYNLANVYGMTGKYTEALSLYTEARTLIEKTKGKNHTSYTVCLDNLATLYENMDKYAEAETIYKEALDIKERTTGKESASYATTLSNLGLLYKYVGNFKAAEPAMKEALLITEKIAGKNDPDYSLCLHNLAALYKATGNFTGAEALYKEAIQIKEKLAGKQNLDYANSLNSLGSLYYTMGRHADAEPLYTEALNLQKALQGINNTDYITSLNNLALLHYNMDNYPLAEAEYTQAIQLIEKVLGTNHPYYASTLNNMGGLYYSLGNYSRAEKVFKRSLAIIEKAFGKKHHSYTTGLSNLAGLYVQMNNYTAAEQMFNTALQQTEANVGKEHPDYITVLANLVLLYEKQRNYTIAETLEKQVLDGTEKIFGKKSIKYAGALNGMASIKVSLKNYAEAEALYQQALQVIEQVSGKQSSAYGIYLNNLGSLYDKMDKYDLAESMYKQALEITERIEGNETVEYGGRLDNLVLLYYFNNKTEALPQPALKALNTFAASSKKIMAAFSEQEKERYLKQKLHALDVYTSMANVLQDDKRFINALFTANNTLNGWLLHGKQLLHQKIMQQRDTEVLSIYSKWQKVKKDYWTALQLTPEQQQQKNLNKAELENESNELEKQLIQKIPGLTDLLQEKGITAADVATKLKDKEVVIQWSYNSYFTTDRKADSVFYNAYIIRKGDTVPQLIKVFEQKKLQQLLQRYYGATSATRSSIKSANTYAEDIQTRLYKLIWQPLEKHLNNATTVYVLPSGLLHKISFAALKNNTGKHLVESIHLHQLLHVRELVNEQEVLPPATARSIALIGGANFDLTKTSTNTITKKAGASKNRNASISSKEITWTYLPGTKTEVETVAKTLKNNWTVKLLTDTNANEQKLKEFSGKKAPAILHIATHGFYFPSNVTTTGDTLATKRATGESNELALTRSGIVLSGVNKYWGKDTLVAGGDDGIVSAFEIANLNLLNTELVVLSACHTALGDINSNEGVYGLQRAFKMAGVNKMIISLWEVPDAETAELMQLFYTSVAKGKGYYQSFREAQNTLKSKYNDPRKWAGFVLVGE